MVVYTLFSPGLLQFIDSVRKVFRLFAAISGVRDAHRNRKNRKSRCDFGVLKMKIRVCFSSTETGRSLKRDLREWA